MTVDGQPLVRGPAAQQRMIALPWWALATLLALLDQATKFLVHTGLPYGVTVSVTGFFNLVHRWNTGAAFSFLAEAGGWQRYFLSTLALVVAAALAWLLRKPLPRGEACGYALILGGALGNATDRIMRSYVIDFLDFHWRGWSWPAFNVADICICVGVGLLIAHSFRRDARQH